MRALRVAVALALFVAGVAHTQTPPPRTASQMVRSELRAGTVQGVSHGDIKRYRASLLALYGDSTSRLLWHINAKRTVQAEAMLAELGDAAARGLLAADYDATALRFVPGVADRARTPTDVEQLRADLWLSLSVMRFTDHLHRGRVNPRPLGFAIAGTHQPLDVGAQVIALSHATNVHLQLDALEPPFQHFRELKTLLARTRTLAKDSTLARLPTLSAPGYQDAHSIGAAPLLRLLTALGDMPIATASPVRTLTDSAASTLDAGIRHFQMRHGLTIDGRVGRVTLNALRTPLLTRVAQIELTMERWRWLPEITAPRLLVVNIPAFRLYALDRTLAAGGERPVERMDVIVGSAYRHRNTPVFTSEMRTVVFHPYWNVPVSIARREELPKLRRDGAYAEREALEIVRGDDTDHKTLPFTEDALAGVAAGRLHLRQRPGPHNALGPVKFIFPNQYDVYLHGTPVQSLFAQTARDFSHGCIRVSEPARLAAFVLRGVAGWDSTRIDGALHGAERMETVVLGQPLPVYVLYETVMIDDNGIAHFYPDVYGHDAALTRALGKR